MLTPNFRVLLYIYLNLKKDIKTLKNRVTSFIKFEKKRGQRYVYSDRDLEYTTNFKINPWFVTGLSDGDGSFYIVLRKDLSCKFGYSIGLEYKVVAGINPLNLKLLKQIQSFFEGVGTISKDKTVYHFTRVRG